MNKIDVTISRIRSNSVTLHRYPETEILHYMLHSPTQRDRWTERSRRHAAFDYREINLRSIWTSSGRRDYIERL